MRTRNFSLLLVAVLLFSFNFFACSTSKTLTVKYNQNGVIDTLQVSGNGASGESLTSLLREAGKNKEASDLTKVRTPDNAHRTPTSYSKTENSTYTRVYETGSTGSSEDPSDRVVSAVFDFHFNDPVLVKMDRQTIRVYWREYDYSIVRWIELTFPVNGGNKSLEAYTKEVCDKVRAALNAAPR